MSILAKRVLFLLIVIGIWQIIYTIGIFPDIVLPPPVDVVIALYEGFRDGTLVVALLASFKHLAIGLPIGVLLGTTIGLLLAKSKQADETAGMYLIALQSIPSIAWVPLSLMIFGFNEMAVIFVVVIGGIFVMALNTRTALRNVPSAYKKAARTMGVNGYKLFFKVEIPSSLPHFMTGIRLAWAFSWRALMAGELLSNGPGLGYSLTYAFDFAQVEMVIAIIIIIGVIGSVVDQFVFSKLEKSVMKRWGLLS